MVAADHRLRLPDGGDDLTTTKTLAATECGGHSPSTAGPHIDTLDKPANFDPAVIGAYGLEPDSRTCLRCGDNPRQVDEAGNCTDCAAEPDDEPHYYVCPTCGGNGCGPCRGTGERLDGPRETMTGRVMWP